MYMSRSVTTPTIFPSSSTGSSPQSASSIIAAAAARLVAGEHVIGSLVMTSLTCTFHLLSGSALRRRRRFFNGHFAGFRLGPCGQWNADFQHAVREGRANVLGPAAIRQRHAPIEAAVFALGAVDVALGRFAFALALSRHDQLAVHHFDVDFALVHAREIDPRHEPL